jgi:hypothetical protein
MSRKSKGNQFERWAMKYLEEQGYVVHRAQSQAVNVGTFHVSRSNDIFHCIDLVAKRANERTRWIQVTSENVGIGIKAKKMEQVPWCSEHDSVEIWQYVQGRHTPATPAQYFRVRKLEEAYEIKDENRIFLSTEWRRGH